MHGVVADPVPSLPHSQKPKLHVPFPEVHSLESLQAWQSGRVAPGNAASKAQSQDTAGVNGSSGAPSLARRTFIAHCGTVPLRFNAPKMSTEPTGACWRLTMT